MLLVSNLGIETIIYMLLVSKPLLATDTTTTNRCLPAFCSEILARNPTQKKSLETLRDTAKTYNTLLSRQRQLALTYCFLLFST